MNTDRPVLEAIKQRYGGDIHPLALRRKGWKQGWQWRLSSTRAINFLSDISDHLVIKWDQAVTAFAWAECRPGKGQKWERDVLDLLVARMRWLNKKGPYRGEDPINPVIRELKTGQMELVV